MVSGPRGLQPGDHVTAVNSCGVRTINDWNECLRKAARSPPSGYCIDATWRARVDLWLSPDLVPSPLSPQFDHSRNEAAAMNQGADPNSESTTFECCPTNASLANTHLCFYRPIPRQRSSSPQNSLHLLRSVDIKLGPPDPSLASTDETPIAPPGQSSDKASPEFSSGETRRSPDLNDRLDNGALRNRELFTDSPIPGPRLEYACLPARSVTEKALCTRDEECLNSHQVEFYKLVQYIRIKI